jgi:hypothetical protein
MALKSFHLEPGREWLLLRHRKFSKTDSLTKEIKAGGRRGKGE